MLGYTQPRPQGFLLALEVGRKKAREKRPGDEVR